MDSPPGGRPAPDLLTTAEAAATLRVSTMTVQRLIHSGELEAIKVGRSFRIHREDLDGYLARARSPSPGHD